VDPIPGFSHIPRRAVGSGATLYAGDADLRAADLKETVRRGPTGDHAVALTFDDGPDPHFTPRVLAILAQFGVRATFFVVGMRAEQHPEIIRVIAEAGHEVGNHTYAHRPLWLLSPRQTRAEIDRCTHVLTTILGKPPRYFRPPWGQSNVTAMRHSARVRQQRVLWSLRGEGWLPLARPEGIVRNVARRLHPGAIIDLHDGGGFAGTPARLVAALPGLLRLIQERGYDCLTLSELLAAGPAASAPATLGSRLWDRYEWAWNTWFGVKRLGQDTIFTLGPAIHYGPDLILRDGTIIHPGAQVGELHLDRVRVAHLHRTVPQRRLGFVLRREFEWTLQRLAQRVLDHAQYQNLEAFRSTTLFWQEATRLGFEVCGQDTGWHQVLLCWYQCLLLARDHPLGRYRLRGRRWEARTIWLARRELLRRYAGHRH
jgi:peptidoglycan/xylan/chitin deacetylase (PgdA/CDA1 family)